MDFQCYYDLANNDGQFLLNKWGIQYWWDVTYHEEYGIYGYHISLRKRETEQDSDEILEEISRLEGKGYQKRQQLRGKHDWHGCK